MRIQELITILGGRPLLPDPLPEDPMTILAGWFDEAHRAKQVPNPNAMLLATSSPEGLPSARVVLCKSLEADRGALVFYTNYESQKGRELEANPRACAVFHWDHAERQVRVTGHVERTSAEQSDAYFATRPLLARLGAWASHQSQPLPVRRDLIHQARAIAKRFDVGLTDLLRERAAPEIPRPPNWGGFRLWAERVELWAGGNGRLHDRAVWTRAVVPDGDSGDLSPASWSKGHRTRLQP